MTPPNPLVAGPIDPTTPFSGAGLLEDGYELVNAIESGDWVAGGLASFSALANTVATAMDPLGSLIAAGLGWLMDHLEPLKGWLNDLTGDAGEVAGFAATWGNIAQHLQQAGETLDSRLADVSSMSGEAIAAYLRLQADVAAHISAAGAWAGGMKTGMEAASMLVQVVHELVRDTLSQLVGSLISYASTLVISLGTATPYVIAQATSRVSAMTARISGTVLKLVDAVTALAKHLDELKALFQRLGDLFSRGPGGGNAPSGPGAPHSPNGTPPHTPPDGTTPDGPTSPGPSVRDQSMLTDEQLQTYLERNYPQYADDFADTGTLPPDVQIPKGPEVLQPDGSIDWSQVPGGGYVLDANDNPIRQPHTPQPGDVLDRYGPPDGRYTSPVPDDGPYTYDQRSLPYVENPAHYHRYEVVGDLSDLRGAFDSAPQHVKDELLAGGLKPEYLGSQGYQGDIAPGFGSPGGGSQVQLPLTAEQLIALGLLKEIP
ncbi:hypothetical protein BMW26_04370 [Microbacterium sp. 1.5R]|uniref:glycohydrolase toxin TNT-related protein n=1 Tax=unclassified Microbacterium TaxID=2609290 RepID=UPI0006F87571|nr:MULTISPECIES: glycohydrolase toxin TNT-related protein [unclassified Microbacterium]APH44288.1 hypothetical protein BMW26_04370 [Microbacterium sp. 1.5R]KRD54531.1 hypothetical protein ASE34_05665 [Microbacterium sp. Root280D1]CAH0232156.1 hypothetical protein SRABI98_02773 [Microbacterium sp. Bi98]